MMNKQRNLLNLLFPAFILATITGLLTSVIIVLYKFCAKHIIRWSVKGYGFIGEHLYFVLPIALALVVLGFLLSIIYKKHPDLKGGGIPSSIGILRGLITFRWLRALLGTFVISLGAFFVGVPLGNEGPSVQMGTALGKATLCFSHKKHEVWDRYLMTGGACAGFAAATGAPVSGILFAVEEAHQKISPMIILVSTISVIVCQIFTLLLAPVFNVSTTLFPSIHVMVLSLKDVWIPVILGVVMGLFAVGFLAYFELINNFLNDKLKKLNLGVKLSIIFILTLVCGLVSINFISTGHEAILELFHNENALYMLVIILFIRSTLTIASNSSGITGGIFLPTLAIGAFLSAIVSKILINYFSLSEQYYSTIVALGIACCVSGIMKMPLTAIVFSVEAFGCYENILYVIIASAVAFLITEIFHSKSINDSVLDNKIEAQNENKERELIDTFVVVKKGSFAVGKQIRDVLWPANLFVLSVTHSQKSAEVDEHGSSALKENDVLHIRYLTYDEISTKRAITAIVGEQNYDEHATDVI